MLKDKLNISVIDIDLFKNQIYSKDKIKSLDINSRYKRFRFFYNSLALNLEDITVRAYMLKQDGKEIFNDLTIIEGNMAELEFTNQALLIPGTLKLELVLYQDDAELSSFLLEYEVIESLRTDNSIESSNEYTALQIVLQKVESWNTNYQKLYDKWQDDLNKLHTDKNTALDDLKNTWDSNFKVKYDGLNKEYSERVDTLESDVLNVNYSENLLNENVNSFKVGTGTVEGIKKDYTEQMEQSIITLDNVVGKTVLKNTKFENIEVNLGLNPVNLNITTNDWENAGGGNIGDSWDNFTSVANTRIRKRDLIDVSDIQFLRISCNTGYVVSVVECDSNKKVISGTGWDLKSIDTLTLLGNSKYIGILIKKDNNENIFLSELSSTGIMIQKLDSLDDKKVVLRSLPNGSYDEINNYTLINRVKYFNTSEDYLNVFLFETFNYDNVDWTRLTIELPNAYIDNEYKILCNAVNVVDFSLNPNEWSQPSGNSIFVNASTTKNRITFMIKWVNSLESAINFLKNEYPRQLIYATERDTVETMDISIVANSNDIICINSPIPLTCTHKVSLNTKSQIEELQEVVQAERKSVWHKFKDLIDVKVKIGETGYIKLPSMLGGFIIQWGVLKKDSSYGSIIQDINYPITFNSIFFTSSTVSSVDNELGNASRYSSGHGARSNSVGVISASSLDDFVNSYRVVINWLAIGK